MIGKRNLARVGVAIICFVFFAVSNSSSARDYVDYVDPLIGTEGDGNTFPGTATPFAIVKLGPDVGDRRSNSGYRRNGKINGFSHTHVSGTGGGPKYGNILFTPTSGKLDIQDYASNRDNQVVSAGQYSVDLVDHQVHVDLTSSHSVGFHKYIFSGDQEKHILVDLNSFLGKGHCCNEAQELVGSEVHIISPDRIEGYSRVRGGWNIGRAYTVYFSAQFDKPADSYGVWTNSTVYPNQDIAVDEGQATGAYFTYQLDCGGQVQIKVGISFVSIGKARANLEKEIPHWDFGKAISSAKNAWNEVLANVEVEGSEDRKAIFYTALYHTMLMPTDRTGENPDWNGNGTPYYDDFYAIWDTFRATSPLLLLIQPDRQREIVNSLIDIYSQEGYFPDARSGNDSGVTQGGSNVDMVIADAFVKDLSGIDYRTAYAGMVKHAEVPPGGDERKYGRGGLIDYNSLGYVSTDFERAGTRTLEYAANDWAIATVANGLGQKADYEKYRARAGNWANLWRDMKHDSFTGFIMPRAKDGSWVDDLTTNHGTDDGRKKTIITTLTDGTWPDFFYESHSWEYSFYVPHDMNALIAKIGGKDAFTRRLDNFFAKDYHHIQNEPGFLTPILYVYSGRHDKTAEQVSRIVKSRYNSTASGIPGNDDAGSMSAWFAFHAMGFFPNTGQDVYVITTPIFEKTTIHLENDRTFVVETTNLSDRNIYIASATLNGKPLDQAWFRHTEIKEGGHLLLNMSHAPTTWGTKNPPPSMSTSN